MEAPILVGSFLMEKYDEWPLYSASNRFADPLYGGNHDKVGWKLLGFPGVASGAYNAHLDNPEVYRAEPVSILDIQQQKAQVDAQGFPKHIMIKAK